MKKATLVIMAAGIGSRFGKGIKQLEPVGPNGEIIMDYSIYDAIEAGFSKVVFVIRKDLEKDFRECVGKKIQDKVEVEYVFQELNDIPEKYMEKLQGRTKPWGTGQAILCCKSVVNEPFLVINADDYYGKDAYKIAYEYLTTVEQDVDRMKLAMVGFVLKNTLSENGTVTRGICKVDNDHMLTDIEETYGIEKCGENAIAEKNGEKIELCLETPVSMNMWALPMEFLDSLEEGFAEFLGNIQVDDVKAEYLLPRIIGNKLSNGELSVKVLQSHDKWFGVTYKEDKAAVVSAIQKLIEESVYPEKLFSKN